MALLIVQHKDVSAVTHHLRRAVVLALVFFLAANGASAPGAQVPGATEYQVKAAFLFNFAKFVEWPPGAFPDARARLNFCIFGEDPFGPEFDQIIEGKTVNGRSLEVKRLENSQPLNHCHVLFISASERRRTMEILRAAQRFSILTVGETDSFARSGGIINFVLHESRIRFEINVAAAKKAGLTISSRLLKLATIVDE